MSRNLTTKVRRVEGERFDELAREQGLTVCELLQLLVREYIVKEGRSKEDRLIGLKEEVKGKEYIRDFTDKLKRGAYWRCKECGILFLKKKYTYRKFFGFGDEVVCCPVCDRDKMKVISLIVNPIDHLHFSHKERR